MTKRRRRRARPLPVAIVAALLCFGAALHPAAAQTEVDVALVLAVDASGSVNATRFELQKHGYAAAFRNPRVAQAIAAGSQDRIAVAMVQWTGPSLHALTVDWTFVHDAASAQALGDKIDATQRELYGGGTSLSGAIDYSMALLAKCPCRSPRRTIDISGDGSNNRGRPAELARDEAVKQGVVINGLPILTLEPDLDSYYRDNVIGGPGSFIITVKNYDAFAQAILDKLVSEIARR